MEGPLIDVGVAGAAFIDNVRAWLVAQLLDAVTETVPEKLVEGKFTVSRLVPCPPTIVTPAGTVH